MFDVMWNLLRITFRPFSCLRRRDGAIREVPLRSWVGALNIMMEEGIAKRLLEVFDADLDASVLSSTPGTQAYVTVCDGWLKHQLRSRTGTSVTRVVQLYAHNFVYKHGPNKGTLDRSLLHRWVEYVFTLYVPCAVLCGCVAVCVAVCVWLWLWRKSYVSCWEQAHATTRHHGHGCRHAPRRGAVPPNRGHGDAAEVRYHRGRRHHAHVA